MNTVLNDHVLNVETLKAESKTVAESVVGGAAFVGAVLWSFLWLPVVAAVSVIGLVAAGGVWIAQKIAAWYNSCYACEVDEAGVEHPYLAIQSGIGKPSVGVMGGRESERITPMISFSSRPAVDVSLRDERRGA